MYLIFMSPRDVMSTMPRDPIGPDALRGRPLLEASP